MARSSTKWYWALVGLSAILLILLFFKIEIKPLSPWDIDKKEIASSLTKLPNFNQLPEILAIPDENKVRTTIPNYTINKGAQKYAKKILSQWKPDYAAVAVMDATTGALLTLVSYTREEGFNSDIIKNNAFPAASVFKIVTATAAIEEGKATPDTVVPFNGKGTTLYKRNVMKQDTNRWTRYPTLKKAFGHSFNTVFGKLGIFYVGSSKLAKYAQSFGFNKEFDSDLPLTYGHTGLPTDDEWSVVEAASGFTDSNTLSPVHGAMMAASIINNGTMMAPYVIHDLKDSETKELLYEATPEIASYTMKPKTALEMRKLMVQTVKGGTVRRQFRNFLRHRKLQDVVVGGKTGSLDSIKPKGRCDWFVGYAQRGQQKLAFAAVTVHEKFWRVKSATVMKDYLAHYFFNY